MKSGWKTGLLVVVIILTIAFIPTTKAAHVSCGNTLTTNTTLDSDLTCSGIGLTVGEHNITIDCDGHVIKGTGYAIYGIANNDYYARYDNITIKNCIITGFSGGINFRISNSNTIINNTLHNNRGYGLELFYFVDRSTIANNTFRNNYHGIQIYESHNNIITDNNIYNNSGSGLSIQKSANNIFVNNVIQNNDRGFGLHESSNATLIKNNMTGNELGLDVANSRYTGNVFHTIDTSNTINGKPIYYLVNQKDMQVPLDAGYVGVVNSTNITVKDLIMANNGQGVLFALTNNSRIENVTAINNFFVNFLISESNNNIIISNNAILTERKYDPEGFRISASSNNTLTDNIVNNSDNGFILLSNSNYNTLANNTARDNLIGFLLEPDSEKNTLISNIAQDNLIDGFNIISSDNVLISNIAQDNGNGGFLVDISYYYSIPSNNTLISNIAQNNTEFGFSFIRSHNAILTNNTAQNNRHGIALEDTSNTTLTENKMLDNEINFDVIRNFDVIGNFFYTIDTSNTINGKPIYYLVNQKDMQVPLDAGYVGVVNSTNITVKDLIMANNGQGVLFALTNNSRIENVTAINNSNGVVISRFSTNNTLISNKAQNNDAGFRIGGLFNTVTDSTANNNTNGFIIGGLNNTLISNNAQNNSIGFTIFGSFNSLTSNIAENNVDGFSLQFTSNNILTSNIAKDNSESGFFLDTSLDNIINANLAKNGVYSGFVLSRSTNNILSNNTAEGQIYGHGYHLVQSSNNILTNNTAKNISNTGFVIYASSNNNALFSNIANNNGLGIWISFLSNDNLLVSNTFCFSNINGEPYYDIYNDTSLNSGYNNTCDNAFNWNDTDSIGCTFVCSFPNLAIVTEFLPANTLGEFSSHQLEARGGTPPYTWSLLNGTLPAGMNLHSDGILNGTPTEAGNFTFSVMVNDINNNTQEKTLTKEVFVTLPPPQLRIDKWGTIAFPGRIVDYFIILANTGNIVAKNISVIETIDTSFTHIVSTNPLGDIFDNFAISWTESLLSPRGIKIFSYRANLNSSTPPGTEIVGGPVCASMPDPNIPPPELSEWAPLDFPEYRVCSTPFFKGGYNCPRLDGLHTGVDLAAPERTPVYPVDYGKVWFVGIWNDDHGLTIIIEHNNLEYSFYSHLNDTFVANGTMIEDLSRPIALTGTTGSGGVWGNRFGCPHLHFTYMVGGVDSDFVINPCNRLHRIVNKEDCTCGDGGGCDSHIQTTPVTRPVDPNEKGVLADKFIKSDKELVYTIHFENVGNRSALDVFITDGLESDLNISTVEIFTRNGSFAPLSEGETLTLFEREKNKTEVIDPENNITVNITVLENWTVTLEGRTIKWSLLEIDLPVNGTDTLLFKIKPNSGLISGTEIRNNATIQFEIFETITTNEVVNIIDDTPPECLMGPLPSITSTPFTITWSGIDPIGEIDSYSIFVSVNGSGYSPFINHTTSTSAAFNGRLDTAYKFICIATDTAGNAEIQAPIAEAETLVVNRPPIAYAGEDQVLECEANLQATALLNGSGSTDTDSTPGTNDDIVSFDWFENYLLLASGEEAFLQFLLGIHNVLLTVKDNFGASDTDDAIITVQDTIPPEGQITAPPENACFGPNFLPVVVEDNFTDQCNPNIIRSYDPPSGPYYNEHGDYNIILTASDSNNSASDTVFFTIDTMPPVINILEPPPNRTIAIPTSLQFSLGFNTSDEDNATGGVVHELIKLNNCTIYDGLSYGNGDGLLSDESVWINQTELCRISDICGFTVLNQPVIRIEASDCGGNIGFVSHKLNGSMALRPGVCGS